MTDPATLASPATWQASINTESATTAPAETTVPRPRMLCSTRAPGLDHAAGEDDGGPEDVTRHLALALDEHAPPAVHQSGGHHRTAFSRHVVEIGLEVRRRRSRVEPVGVVGTSEEVAVAHHGREGLPLDGDPPALGDPLQDGRLEHVGPRVDLVRRRLVARRLLDEGGDPTLGVGGHHAEGRGIGHGMQRDRPLRPAVAVEAHQAGEVHVGQHVAVHHDEGVGDAGEGRRKAHRAGGVERLGLDGVGQRDPGGPAVRVRLHEGVGQVAEGEDGLVHTVGSKMPEHPLDHRHPDDGEHLLGGREREGTQPRSLAPDEDDRLHYLVVVVDEGFVVVVVGAAVVVVVEGAVVVVAAVELVVAEGAEVGVVVADGVEVVVATGWLPARTWSNAVIVEPGGLGSVVPAGTKPTVMSWRLRSLRSAGLGELTPLVWTSWLFLVCVVTTHHRADTSPTLPASGVPAAHFSPFLYSGTFAPGYFRVVLVSVRPWYSLANLPTVALAPASPAFLGAISRTPLPVVVSPEVELAGDAVRAGCVVPQMSKEMAACQVVPTVGGVVFGDWL